MRSVIFKLFNTILVSSLVSSCLCSVTLVHAGDISNDTSNSKEVKEVTQPSTSRTKFSIFLDSGVTFNTSSPDDGVNYGRLLDDRSNELLLNQLTLTVERPLLPPEPGKYDFGFKFQFSGGSDARYLNPIGELERVFNDRYTIAVVEAYGNIHIPLFTAGGFDLKLGQFVSPMTDEALDPRGNYFYSHSYLFNFGDPFQHLGAMVTLHTTKQLDLYAACVRGSNMGLDDNNSVESFLGGFVLTLCDGKLVLAGNTSIGAENPRVFSKTPVLKGDGEVATIDINNCLRYYNDVNITYKLTDKLTLITDSIYSRDDGFRVDCYGVGQKAIYALNKYINVVGRGEVFVDSDSFFVGQYGNNIDYTQVERGKIFHLNSRTVSGDPTHPSASLTYYEATLGVNIKPIDHVLIRPEIRYDKVSSGRHVYVDSKQSHQFTVGADALIMF